MEIKFCGAAQNVTGSRHLLTINNKKILLDCGMFQGGDREETQKLNQEFLFEPKEVDFLILSHAHIDHSGSIPRLVHLGFAGKIFSTKATYDLVDVMLRDSAHIQKQDAEYIQRKFKKKVIPIYDEMDVNRALDFFETYEYNQKFKIADGIWCTFYDAGHVFGSAIVVLDFKDLADNQQKRLVFTGDLGRKYMPILNDPYQVTQANYLITESTYASHLHDSIKEVYGELELIVNNVYNRGGKIIIPGFSLERTQELVYVLHELYDQGKIPAMPIFIDSPLSVEISKIFDKNINYYDNETFRTFLSKNKNPFYFKHAKYIKDVAESKKLNSYKGPCIIISASGMCTAGRIKHHLANHMTNEKNLILVVGFMAKGTRGREIVEGKKEIRIFGKNYPLRAEVVVMNAFSAHADKLELLENIKNIKGLENIFIVHGEETECAVLRDNIYNILKFKGRVDVVDMGEEFELINHTTTSKLGKRRNQYLKEMSSHK